MNPSIREGTITGVSGDRVTVTLSNGNTLNAVKIAPLDKNPSNQLMEVQSGTAVTVLSDGLGNNWALGASSQKGSGGESLIQVMMDLCDTVKDIMIDHAGEHPLTGGSKSAVDGIKSRLQNFKA